MKIDTISFSRCYTVWIRWIWFANHKINRIFAKVILTKKKNDKHTNKKNLDLLKLCSIYKYHYLQSTVIENKTVTGILKSFLIRN